MKVTTYSETVKVIRVTQIEMLAGDTLLNLVNAAQLAEGNGYKLTKDTILIFKSEK